MWKVFVLQTLVKEELACKESEIPGSLLDDHRRPTHWYPQEFKRPQTHSVPSVHEVCSRKNVWVNKDYDESQGWAVEPGFGRHKALPFTLSTSRNTHCRKTERKQKEPLVLLCILWGIILSKYWALTTTHAHQKQDNKDTNLWNLDMSQAHYHICVCECIWVRQHYHPHIIDRLSLFMFQTGFTCVGLAVLELAL